MSNTLVSLLSFLVALGSGFVFVANAGVFLVQ